MSAAQWWIELRLEGREKSFPNNNSPRHYTNKTEFHYAFTRRRGTLSSCDKGEAKKVNFQARPKWECRQKKSSDSKGCSIIQSFSTNFSWSTKRKLPFPREGNPFLIILRRKARLLPTPLHCSALFLASSSVRHREFWAKSRQQNALLDGAMCVCISGRYKIITQNRQTRSGRETARGGHRWDFCAFSEWIMISGFSCSPKKKAENLGRIFRLACTDSDTLFVYGRQFSDYGQAFEVNMTRAWPWKVI